MLRVHGDVHGQGGGADQLRAHLPPVVRAPMVPDEGQVRARASSARAVPEVQGALRHGQRGDGLHGRAQGRARRDFILPDALPDARRARRRPGRRPGRRRRRRRPRLPARWGGSIGRRHSWRRDGGAGRDAPRGCEPPTRPPTRADAREGGGRPCRARRDGRRTRRASRGGTRCASNRARSQGTTRKQRAVRGENRKGEGQEGFRRPCLATRRVSARAE
mmetsp:Transcript_7396/g.33708  ORF Transcript_7396/g.33708 Transcript_7396/m.33708 type:complete len:219 (+) Transcript_7396:76-732(+)